MDLYARSSIIAKNLRDAWPGDTGIIATIFF